MQLDVFEIIKIIIIGIIEGITEWLPISSTGHMLLFDELFSLKATEEFKEVFFVVIQLGAILAVVALFFKKMFPFDIENRFKIKKETFTVWFKVAAACVPSAVLGLIFDDIVESYFGTPLTIAIMLVVYGVLFIVVERCNSSRTLQVHTIEDISWKSAVIIGMFQVLAFIPGTSRSGATIIGALIIGVSRVAAAEFTFFLAVPTMLGASFLKIVKYGMGFTTDEIIALVIGMAVSFVVSLAAIKFLMEFVRRHSFELFGWYRIVLGILVVIFVLIL